MESHDESLPELMRGTIRDGLGLLRDEMVLVRTELREEYARLKSGLIAAVAAAVAGVQTCATSGLRSTDESRCCANGYIGSIRSGCPGSRGRRARGRWLRPAWSRGTGAGTVIATGS